MSHRDPETIERIVERTGMRRADIEAVLQELIALDHDRVTARPGERPGAAVHPTEPQINALIIAASKHPLGTDFLLSGHLGTVAITFGVHAFIVEAARMRLRGGATG